MIDLHAAQVRCHRRNIERYCRILATDLTDLERQYLHKRIAEEHAQLERLEKSMAILPEWSLLPERKTGRSIKRSVSSAG
jgi:hypothetical protein